ncbi:MAG: hypothetical protein ACI8R9_001672 [Paraglaciecola sp.]|jgi:hypothetical protein
MTQGQLKKILAQRYRVTEDHVQGLNTVQTISVSYWQIFDGHPTIATTHYGA